MRERYAIQNLTTKNYLTLSRGVRWISSAQCAVQFRLPETARAIARAMVSRYADSYMLGRVVRIESRELRLAVVPVGGR